MQKYTALWCSNINYRGRNCLMGMMNALREEQQKKNQKSIITSPFIKFVMYSNNTENHLLHFKHSN